MHLPQKLSRFSGVIFSGILLAGSLAVQPSQVSAISPRVKPAIAANDTLKSNIWSLNLPSHVNTGTSTVMADAAKTSFSPTKQVQEKDISQGQELQPVHIALAASQKTPTETKQVSRGSDQNSSIVEHALSLLGTPYIYGGTTRNGFDCSGFTQYVLAGSGISLPRTSYSQFSSGVNVSKDALQPGDLVFFSTYSKGASHVGIYIGGGSFIHADNPRVGVTITSLSNSYYTAHYLGARRFVQ